MHQIIRKILKKMIKEPHLDHTQALSSYVSGFLGTLKKCFYGLEIFSNPLIDFTTKRSNKSRSKENEMMRSVVFDVSGILEAFDYRGVIIHKQEIQANEKIKLPFTEKNLFKFNGVFFGVCEGVGNLDYRDYPKNINFNALLCETIENYLLNAKEPENKQQKALLADFLEVYDKNITKGVYYLKPKFFAEKEKQLIERILK